MSTTWVSCSTGGFTRVYQSASPFGFVYLWAQSGGPVPVTYREYSSSPPFFLESSITVTTKTTLVVGPTPYIELWIKPTRSGFFRVT
jgi:hypothetical protein